jgi:hypothetical protein
VIAFGFSFLITKSFSLRYIVAGAILPAIAFPYMLDQVSSRRFVALALTPLIGAILISQSHLHTLNRVADVLMALQILHPTRPVVVGEGLLFIELMESADAATKAMLVYLKSPSGSVSPDPTNENEVSRLAAFHSDYRVSDQRTFLANNSRFYVIFRPNATTDTTTPSLIEKGLLTNPIKIQQGILLFDSKTPTEVQ